MKMLPFWILKQQQLKACPKIRRRRTGTNRTARRRCFLLVQNEIALKHEPVIISEGQAKVDKLQDIAERLRGLAGELKLIGTNFSRRYAEKLEKVAANCDDDAKIMRPNPANAPWLVPRKRGDLRRRTIVGKLASTTHELFYKIFLAPSPT